jgi:hypothetical protein
MSHATKISMARCPHTAQPLYRYAPSRLRISVQRHKVSMIEAFLSSHAPLRYMAVDCRVALLVVTGAQAAEGVSVRFGFLAPLVTIQQFYRKGAPCY